MAIILIANAPRNTQIWHILSKCNAKHGKTTKHVAFNDNSWQCRRNSQLPKNSSKYKSINYESF